MYERLAPSMAGHAVFDLTAHPEKGPQQHGFRATVERDVRPSAGKSHLHAESVQKVKIPSIQAFGFHDPLKVCVLDLDSLGLSLGCFCRRLWGTFRACRLPVLAMNVLSRVPCGGCNRVQLSMLHGSAFLAPLDGQCSTVVSRLNFAEKA